MRIAMNMFTWSLDKNETLFLGKLSITEKLKFVKQVFIILHINAKISLSCLIVLCDRTGVTPR